MRDCRVSYGLGCVYEVLVWAGVFCRVSGGSWKWRKGELGAKQGETVRYGLENNTMKQRETRGMCQ